MSKKKGGLAAEVRQLRKEFRRMKAEVHLLRSAYFELTVGPKPGLLWEDFVLSRHPVIRASIEAADRETKKKGGLPLEKVIQRLERKGQGPGRPR